MKLYDVMGPQGLEVTTDMFVVAEDVPQAIEIWNQACIDREWPRSEDDSGDAGVSLDPFLIRTILVDVSGTIYDKGARAVDWGELETWPPQPDHA